MVHPIPISRAEPPQVSQKLNARSSPIPAIFHPRREYCGSLTMIADMLSDRGTLYDTFIIIRTHADVCISKGGIVTLDDAYIRQGGKMMT